MTTILDLIQREPLFALLTPSQSGSLAGAVSKRCFKRGECIVQQGNKCESLFIILAGRARVVLSDRREREVILATLHPGDYFGEMSLIDHEPHSATVKADLQTDALILDGDYFNRCLLENRFTAAVVMKGLVRRLRSADRKVESLALMNVYERVATVLLDSASPNADNIRILRDKLFAQDIAKMVGASREMVSRVMKEFEMNGFIKVREDGSLLIEERRLQPRLSDLSTVSRHERLPAWR